MRPLNPDFMYLVTEAAFDLGGGFGMEMTGSCLITMQLGSSTVHLDEDGNLTVLRDAKLVRKEPVPENSSPSDVARLMVDALHE